MNNKKATIYTGNISWQVEQTTRNILCIHSIFLPHMYIELTDFFQLVAICLHARMELDYVKKNFAGQDVLLRAGACDTIELSIEYDGMDKVTITANKFAVSLDQRAFDMMIESLYDAVNQFVTWYGFDAKNYDPAFLNVMLAKELPYICGEEICDMSLGVLLVPHVPYQPNVSETVTLEECVRVNSLRKVLDIDSFNRRDSNHYGQSNSIRLNSILDMVKEHGYPYNNEYITIYNTSNLIVDGWHRAACLYYLYGDIIVPVKVIHLNK